MNAFLTRFSFVFVVFFQVVSGNATEPLAQKWVTRYSVPGAMNTMPAAVAADANGDVYVGSFVEVSRRAYRATVSKLSGTTGTPLWRWQSSFDVASDAPITLSTVCRLAIGPDGNPVAAFRNWVVKLHGAEGNELWSAYGPLGYFNSFYELTLDPSGDVLLVGVENGGKAWKIDRQTGLRLWERSVTGAASLKAVRTDADGNVYVAGETSAQPQQPCTAKLSPAGVVMWTKTDAAEAGRTRLMVLDPAGNPIVATYEGRLLKYSSSDGSLQWSVAGLTNPNDLVLDAAGDIYLAQGGGTYPDQSDSRVAKYFGAFGSLRWILSNQGFFSYKVNLLVHGGQLLTYGSGSSSSGLALGGVEPQNGLVRWYQRYFGSSASAVATTGTRAVKLMASLPDGGIVVAGTVLNPWGYFENVVLKYGIGPSLANLAADWVLQTRAQLRATATGNFAPSEIFWEYGLTTAYGNSTPRQTINEGWTPGPPTYRAIIEGLLENTLYHARAVAVSARGTTVTSDITFTTGWDANRNKLPDEWELEKWGNTSTRYATSDEDQDGTSNLLEYALDRHPQIGDAGIVPPATIDADGHLSMTIIKRPHVTLEVEASTDLLSWVPAIIVREDDTSVTAREEFPPNTPGGRFLRVRATSE